MIMKTKYSPQETDFIAAEWAARRLAGLSPEDSSALEAWLALDIRHLGAYAKAEAVLAQLERVGAAGSDALRKDVPIGGYGAIRRRAVLAGSVAAGLAVMAGGTAWLVKTLGSESYSTRVGETKEVVLSDGSIVVLNTDTKISVDYSKAKRQIRLVQGEALFDVAKNKKRPFIVTAGDTQIRAVGTSFTVRLLPQQPVQVLVREGVVEVKRPSVPLAPSVRLPANMLALASPEAPISAEPVLPAQVARGIAWREGRIVFDNETLGNAAREFARYSDIRIRVAPGLEDQTITGLYVSNDPVGFARAAALSLNLHLEMSNREVRLDR